MMGRRERHKTHNNTRRVGLARGEGLGVGGDRGGAGEERRQELREGEDALEVEGEELSPGLVRVCCRSLVRRKARGEGRFSRVCFVVTSRCRLGR